MQLRNISIYFAFIITLCLPTLAFGSTYVIAPFSVSGPAGYSYLGQAIPSTMNTRLAWPGQYEAVSNQASVLNGLAPATQDAAERIRGTHHADVIIWGDVRIEGDNAVLSVNAQDAQGIRWQRSGTSALTSLMNDLQQYADGISQDVFGRSATQGIGGGNILRSPGSGGTSFDTAILNPELRYQQSETDRSRTQMMDYEGLGLDVADLDGDGLNEVLVLTTRYLYAYRMQDGLLRELASHRLPSSMDPLLVRAVNLNGRPYVVVGGHITDTFEGSSQILTFSGNSFDVVVSNAGYYLNVLDLPNAPSILIGQSGSHDVVLNGPNDDPFNGAIYQMSLDGNRLRTGDRIAGLPRESTVLNAAWLPSGGGNYAILALDDKLNVYDGNRRLYRTNDMFSATVKGVMPINNTVGYYFPARSVIADLDRNGIWEVLAIKPLTTGGQFFSNYRTYPQGEVHALTWDGMSLNTLWKTNVIQGTLVDLCLGDADNNGSLDLLVQVNSYPGGLGIGQVRSTIVYYPLDQGMAQGLASGF